VAAVRIPARKATLVVSPQGSDRNPGTAARPFATVGRAAQVARAGDVVDVRRGVYRLASGIHLGANGTPSRRILLRAHPGEKVVLDGGRLGAGAVVVAIAGRYVDLQGFEIRGAASVGVSVWGGAHVRVVGNRIHGLRSAGVFVGYDRPGVVTDVDVSGNTVWDNSTAHAAHREGGGWGQGISAAGTSSRVRITGNRVFHTHGEGIGVLGVGITVSGNVVHDNFAAGIYVDQGTRSTISRNLVYTTGDRAFFRFGMPSTMIQIANEGRQRPELLTRLVISDNVLLGGRSGIGYWSSYGVGGGLRNSTITHNTLVGSSSENLLVQPDPGHRGTVVRDNLVVKRGAGRLADVPRTAGLRFRHNCWTASPPAAAADRAGDVVAVPRFVRPGGLRASDHRLRAGSPCAGFGARL
jgi:parallel beta-helix repeat protein